MKRFRGGLVFQAHRLLYHSTLGSRVIKKKKKKDLEHVLQTLLLGAVQVQKYMSLKYEPASEPLHIYVK